MRLLVLFFRPLVALVLPHALPTHALLALAPPVLAVTDLPIVYPIDVVRVRWEGVALVSLEEIGVKYPAGCSMSEGIEPLPRQLGLQPSMRVVERQIFARLKKLCCAVGLARPILTMERSCQQYTSVQLK